MAKYLTNIELEGNQLINALIHPAASAPTALGDGQAYYNTAGDVFWGRVNSAWKQFAMVDGSSPINIDHGTDLAGLGDDDHSQYALLVGRAGSQTLRGGANASGTLHLGSTTNASKGYIELEDTTRLTTATTGSFADHFVLRDSAAGELQTFLPSGTANSSTFLRGDGQWATPAGGYSNWSADADSGGPDVVNDADTVTWTGGTGINSVMTGAATASPVITTSLDYTGVSNYIDSTPINLEGTAIALADTIAYHDATNDNVTKGLVSDLPFVTSVGITDGNLIDSSGGPITDSGNITINVDLIELTDMGDGTGIVGTADYMVVLDANTNQRKKKISTLNLGQFNNDQGWTSNAGTVTTVTAGDGLTGGGSPTPTITLGGPGSTTGTSTNNVTASSHTHALDLTGADSTELDDTANIVYTNAVRSISVTHSIATGSKLTLVDQPASDTDAANKLYVDTVAQGLDAKQSVHCMSDSNLDLTGEETIDGQTTSTSRVLVTGQTATEDNGIYVSAAGAWSRASDANTWDELVSAFVFVEEGTTYGDTGWVCTIDTGGTLGSTAVTWAQFSGAGSYTAGAGLDLTGSEFAVDLGTNSGLTVAGDTLQMGTPSAITGSSTNSVTTSTHTHAVTTGITSGAILESSGGTNGHVAIYTATGIGSEAVLSPVRGGTGIVHTAIADGQIMIGHNANNNWVATTPTAAATSGTGAQGTALNWNTGAGTLSINAIAASTTLSGVVELATQAEVDATTLAGNFAVQAVTPGTLRGSPNQSANYTAGGSNTSTRKFVKGTTAATSTTVTHNLGTREVVVDVFDASSYDTVHADVVRTSTNVVTVTFATAPSANEYVIVVVG